MKMMNKARRGWVIQALIRHSQGVSPGSLADAWMHAREILQEGQMQEKMAEKACHVMDD